jgi:hypothetical protein
MLRNPVQRAISYYYERIYPSYPVPISTLHPKELDTLLASFVRISDNSGADLREPIAGGAGSTDVLLANYLGREGTVMDEGPTNTLTRMFSGNNKRKGQPTSKIFSLNAGSKVDSKRWELDKTTLDIAKTNLATCVVGMQEEWQPTVQVLERWFPWVKERVDAKGEAITDSAALSAMGGANAHAANPLMVRAHAGKNKPKKEEQLSEDLLEVIRRHNRYDLELYEFGTAIFKQQIALLMEANTEL